MDYTILTIIIILAAIGVYELLKRAYKFLIYQFNRILSLETQGKFNATHFNKIRNDIADMDSYHHRMNRDNANFTIKYNKVIDKFKKGLGNAFKWLAKLEGFVEANEGSLVKVWTRIKKVESRLKSLEDIQLIHAHSISDLEKKVK